MLLWVFGYAHELSKVVQLSSTITSLMKIEQMSVSNCTGGSNVNFYSLSKIVSKNIKL